MNRILEAVMKRSMFIIMALVILLVWGGISAYRMKRDYLPSIDNPTLMVAVHAPDYQAGQIKSAVTEPIERAVRKVSGLETLETNSFDGGLLVSLYFRVGYDMNRAENDVSYALDHAFLPAGVDKPSVTRVSTSSFPIMRISLTSPSGKMDENTLRTSAQTQIAAELKSLSGVSDVRVTGGGNNGYALTLRMADLSKAGLTIEDVKSSLAEVHLDGVQGKITNSQVSIPLQATGPTPGERELKQLPIRGADGHHVPLAAIGDLSKSIVDLQTVTRTDGKPSVVMDVLKTTSSDITEVSERIRSRIQNMPGVQAGELQLTVLFDQGQQVQSSLNGLVKEGLLGCLLSMVCVFLFFRNIRSTVLIALSLPICLMTAAGLLKTMGFSLNLLTVSGMIVAMGRAIDDTIVVLDNMHRKAEEWKEKLNTRLLVEAVKEMVPAIVSSTATTAAVYIPIALVGGMISSAFSGFAWSVVIAIVTSLLVAALVVPSLYHLWQGVRAGARTPSIEPGSLRVLSWAFRRKGWIAAVCAGLLVIAVAGVFFLPVNFLPANKSGQINVQLEFPQGTTLTQVDAAVKRMEQALQSDAAVASFSSVLGSSFTPQFDDVFDAGGGWIQGSNIANIAVSVKELRNVDRVAAELQQRLAGLSGGAVYTVSNQNIAGDDSQLRIDLSGADALTLDQAARLIRSKLGLIQGLGVAGSADDKEGAQRFQLVLNREALERTGVSPEEVFGRVRDYLSEGMRIDVRTRGQEKVPFTIHTDLLAHVGGTSVMAEPQTGILTLLGKETFKGLDGKTVRLEELASLNPSSGPSVIREREGRPFTVVTANIVSRDVEKVTGQVNKVLDELVLPPGVHYTMNGISAQVDQMILEMGIALSVSIILVLFILSIVFRGWRAPLTVLLCIPLAFIGSILGMLVWGGEWNLASLVGLLMLSGIVATNGIVLVDKIERNLNAGISPKDAILQGTVTRVRPVLMTAITTIMTLLPLCVTGGGDTVFSQTLGIVVVCGMISSTLISLVVIPLLYACMLDRQPLALRKMKRSESPVISAG
ncbi:efflux RND transporter permease subunit [Paenibacillus filicis]|uniref:Efflux RND transporter permease subunit n=1 Tax=Paenibacillus gyeongsangnamensis TaxID=3388067 RepID=A0ABT4QBZ9_9BACL|nr:efflux RND transporter permease subunit [Paenibacillus filicis]MCZ8514413.1 efflux RND transporter permease subunit [Paenibacillus filicis]